MKWYDVITDSYVENAVIGYMQDVPLEVFDIFPEVKTSRMFGSIPAYAKEDWFRIGDLDMYKRSGATESVGDTFGTEKINYLLEQFSFHKDVTKDDVEQTESPYNAVDDAARFVVNRLRRVAMKLVLNTFMDNGIWANNEDVGSTASDQWDNKSTNVSTADPIEKVLEAKMAIERVTGFDPRKLIITPDVYKALRTNTFVTNALKVTSDKVVTKDALARLMDLDKIVVMNAINESATDYFASKKALLVYTPEGSLASKEEPSAGVILSYMNKQGLPASAKRIPMPQRNDALRIETDFYLDPVVTAVDCGYFMYNVVS